MHVRTHTREHLYYCSQCHYSSITKNCLKRHVIQKHSNILLKCPTDGCDYSTPDKYKLQAHLKVHTELVSSKPKWQPPPSPGCPVLSHIYAQRGIPCCKECEHAAPSRRTGALLLPLHASQSFHPPAPFVVSL
ncbi:zinc finger protein ZFAT isoform X3 [Sigmodon hispidus]